jgi:hypothetical protein
MDDRSSIPGRVREFFSSPTRPDLFGILFILLSYGYRGLLAPGIIRPGREAYHSPPSKAGVKNPWTYTSIPPYVFMAWYLVKYRIRLHGMVKARCYLMLFCGSEVNFDSSYSCSSSSGWK